MKTLLTCFSFWLAAGAFGQGILGEWKTIDDKTNTERSVVEITKRGDKYYGKITKIYLRPGESENDVCTLCDEDDPRFEQPIKGMEILRDLVKDGTEYSDGDILDPENGNVYTCKVWLENGDLKVRGYWGVFFRTQTWKRLSP